jgi:AbrB family looped-hinge helix DNA binding protein
MNRQKCRGLAIGEPNDNSNERYPWIDDKPSKTHLTLMNAKTTMSAKGQVVIPKDVRDALGLFPGQRLEIIRSGNGLLLRPADSKSGRSFDEITAHIREIAPPWEGPPATDADMKAAVDEMVREDWAKKQ